MALKAINKINLGLKFLHRTDKFSTEELQNLLSNAIYNYHFANYWFVISIIINYHQQYLSVYINLLYKLFYWL